MRSDRRFTDFGSGINRYCERRSPTPLRHPAISKMSYAISSPCSRRKDTNYMKAGHELHELPRMFRRRYVGMETAHLIGTQGKQTRITRLSRRSGRLVGNWCKFVKFVSKSSEF